MIYTKNKNAKEDAFITLLDQTKLALVKVLRVNNKVAPLSFERLVCDKMCNLAVGTEFENTIQQTGSHNFPDIIAKKYFGVEVKTTIKNQWISTGNSVMESLRVKDVERIYIMFGKLGGKPDVRFRLYQECIPEVSVTHSPRYKINMDLPIGKSIFNKMGVDYEVLRKSDNTIQVIRNYYREQLKDGEELWWIDESTEETSPSLIISTLRSFDKSKKEKFIIESMILFPEIFGKNPAKFERVAAYLVTQYNAVSSNIRDTFTAGGTMTIKINKSDVLVPRIVYNLSRRSIEIQKQIELVSEETLEKYWRIDTIQGTKIQQWKKLLNKRAIKTGKYSVSDFFDAGLTAD